MVKSDFDITMHAAQKKMLAHAERIASNSGINLDYGSSMVQLDSLLEKVSAEIRREGLTNERDIRGHDGVRGIAESLACYIVETMEKNGITGEWVNGSTGAANRGAGFKSENGKTMYPMEWIVQKLIDPNGYSVERVYRQYVGS